jgi:hypothetical protein
MTQIFLSAPYDQLGQFFAEARRFGRQIRPIDCADPEMAPARTTTVVRMRARIETGEYRSDPDVVANAIVDRLVAGGLKTRAHSQTF